MTDDRIRRFLKGEAIAHPAEATDDKLQDILERARREEADDDDE